jgi:hypothetical protein
VQSFSNPLPDPFWRLGNLEAALPSDDFRVRIIAPFWNMISLKGENPNHFALPKLFLYPLQVSDCNFEYAESYIAAACDGIVQCVGWAASAVAGTICGLAAKIDDAFELPLFDPKTYVKPFGVLENLPYDWCSAMDF